MERRARHAVMVPVPTPGHMDPMLKLAKLLHTHGFHITYVITHYIHHCLASSDALPPLHDLDGFRLEVVSDGLPLSGREGMKYLKELTVALGTTFVSSLRERVAELRDDPTLPPVSCLVSGLLGPAVEVAEEIGVPGVLFWTTSACGFMSTLYMEELIGRGYLPLREESFLTNGYLDTMVDWIPGLRPLRLRDTTSFVKTTDPHDVNLQFHLEAATWASRASAVILNTFDELEHDAIEAMRPKFKRLYTIGPLSALRCSDTNIAPPISSVRLSLWKEDRGCLSWLDKQEANSVLYISFGSISMVQAQQLEEFAWGIAASGLPFLWVVRPNIVVGERAVLPEGFAEETEGRSFICGWCPQEEVMAHRSVGGFLTHGGWNSMLEGIRRGVPMMCWLSVFADQPTNCRYACEEWGVAMEMGEGKVERGRVGALVRELMVGELGRALRERSMEWKEKAEGAIGAARKEVEELVMSVANGQLLRMNETLVPVLI